MPKSALSKAKCLKSPKLSPTSPTGRRAEGGDLRPEDWGDDRAAVIGDSSFQVSSFIPHPSPDGLRPAEFWALRDISFDLKRGECLGLIGRNGCGKTTLLRLIAGIFPPDQGEIAIRGRVGALIALGAGFHPHMTGRENVYLGVLHSLMRHISICLV